MIVRRMQLAFFAIAVAGAFAPAAADAAVKITSVDFKGTGDPQIVEVRADGPVTFEKQENAQDKQVILEINDATISTAASRKIDTSSFNSSLLMISPYQVPGEPSKVRVVLQLRDNAPTEASASGNGVRISIPSPAGAATQAPAPEAPAPAQAPDASELAAAPPAPPVEAPAAPEAGAPAPVPASEKVIPTNTASKFPQVAGKQGVFANAARGSKIAQDDAEEAAAAEDAEPELPGGDRLKRLIDNRAQRTFTGRPITLQVRDMDAVDVFRLIGEASGFNIIMGDDVQGKVTLSLVDVPWDQALDVVLQSLGLTAERNKNILRILSLANMTAEKIAELRAANAAKAATPKITRIFPISYANLTELSATISQLLAAGADTAGGGGGGAAAGGEGGAAGPAAGGGGPAAGGPPGRPGVPGGAGRPGARGGPAAGGGAGGEGGGGRGGSVTGNSILTDKRTNSLIIRDIPENIDRIAKLIELLDVQTPQIMIEGKVVEATESFSKSLNGALGLQGSGSSNFFASMNGGNPVDPLIGGVIPSSSFDPATTADTGQIGLAFIPGVQRLNAVLQLGEQESKLKLIGSPKTVVQNKEKASIIQSTPVAIPVVTTTSAGTVTSYDMKEAKLSLDVTPTVTNDGSVRLELSLSRDIPLDAGGVTGIGLRNIKTDVIVENGTTLVMGGVYTVSSNDVESGFPFLRKIPLLGTLFGSNTSTTTRSELFFFVTPQIINPKRAGFGS